MDPSALLARVESGRATVEIPMRAGAHRIKGHTVRVRPGTVMTVEVEVRNGQVVPSAEGPTGVRFTPALEGPLWTTAEGVQLLRSGERGQPVIDVRGWFDQAAGDARPLDLARFLQGASAVTGPRGRDASTRELLDFPQARFHVRDVALSAGPLQLGETILELVEGGQLDLTGRWDDATLTGALRIGSGTVRGEGLSAELGSTSVDLAIRTRSVGEGREVRLRLDGGSLALLELTLNGAGQLQLGPSTLHGQLQLKAAIDASGRADVAAGLDGRLQASSVRGHWPLPDAEGDAQLRIERGRLDGTARLSPEGWQLQVSLQDGALDLRDLDVPQALSLERARFEGDARLSLDPNEGLSAHVRARQLDVRLEDYRPRGSGVDLGPTRVRGRGEAWLDARGLRLEGPLDLAGTVDSMKVVAGQNGAQARLEIGPSTLNGRLRHLEVGEDQAPRFNGRFDLDVAVIDGAVEVPGLAVSGHGRIQGPAELDVAEGQVRLTDSEARLDLEVKDGRIGREADGFYLDLAARSRAQLNLRDVELDNAPRIAIGPGSQLDVRLDEGHLLFGARDLRFEPGTWARMNIERWVSGPDGLPELVGTLELDAPLDLDQLPEAHLVPGRPDIGGPSAVGLRVDEVRLGRDGRFRLDGVEAHLDVGSGRVEAIRGRQVARLEALLDAHPAIQTQQDLINHFYAAGGGDWSGAVHAAEAYGVKLETLVEHRGGAVDALRAPGAELDAAFALAPLDLPSMETVAAQSAETLVGLEILRGPADPWAWAKALKDGRLEVRVPMEGTTGRWPRSVSFDAGTHLDLSVEVRDGKILPETFVADLNQSGDAFLWSTLEGAYLDEDRNLKLDVWGWGDGTVTGLDALPLEVGALVERFQGLGTDGAGRGVAQWSQATVAMQGARFEAGQTLTLPNGALTFGDSHRLTVQGGPDALRIEGAVALEALDFGGEELALSAGATEAQLRVEMNTQDGRRHTRVVLADLETRLEGLGYKSRRGAFVALGAGQAEGRVELDVTVHPDRAPEVRSEIALERFRGRLEGARFLAAQPGGERSRLELSGANYDGRLVIDERGHPRLRGRIENLEGALRDLTIATVDGPLDVASARFQASGELDYGPGQLTLRDGQLRGSAVLSANPQGLDLAAGALRDVDIDGGRAVLRFDIEHFDELAYGPDEPLVLDALQGRLGGSGAADQVRGQFRPKGAPADSTRPGG